MTTTPATTLPVRRTRSGVPLTVAGLGGAQFGNLFREIDEADVDRIIDAAWAAGIRYFDTAPHYGMGLSERRLGRALQRYPRDEFVLSTKVGRIIRDNPGGTGWDEQFYRVPRTTKRVLDYTADGVRTSIEESLDRLGLDRIDLVYIHDPDEYWDDAINGAVPALQELRAAGTIGGFGAGVNQSAPLERLIREGDADVVMVAGRYTLLEQGALDDLLPAAAETGASVVIAGVYNSGLLARPRPPADANYDYETVPAEVLQRAHAIADVCERFGTTLPDAAVAFVLRNPSVVSVAFGVSRPEQLDQNLERLAASVPTNTVPHELWTELEALGLIRTEGQ